MDQNTEKALKEGFRAISEELGKLNKALAEVQEDNRKIVAELRNLVDALEKCAQNN